MLSAFLEVNLVSPSPLLIHTHYANIIYPALSTRTPSQVNSSVPPRASKSTSPTFPTGPVQATTSKAKGSKVVRGLSNKNSISLNELEIIGGADSKQGSMTDQGFNNAGGTNISKETFVDEASLTPVQLSNAENLGAVLGCQDDVEPDEAAATALFDELEHPIEGPTLFTMPGLDFITRLSRINIVCNQTFGKSKTKAIPDTFRGNSRSEPVLFQYNCTKTPGCQYFAHAIWTLYIHEARCTAELVEAAAADRDFCCDIDGCLGAFSSAEALKAHKAREHEWEPKPCPKKGCNPSYLFKDPNEYKRHQKSEHSPWTPKPCPMDGCLRQGDFTLAQSLKTHLQTIHKISDPAIIKEHCYVRNPPYVPQKCNMPACGHPNVYSSKKELKKHYKREHGLDLDEANEYISLV